MAVRERELIAANEQIVDRLTAEIDLLVQDIEQDYNASRDEPNDSASTGRIIALIIGVVAIASVLLGAGMLVLQSQRA